MANSCFLAFLEQKKDVKDIDLVDESKSLGVDHTSGHDEYNSRWAKTDADVHGDYGSITGSDFSFLDGQLNHLSAKSSGRIPRTIHHYNHTDQESLLMPSSCPSNIDVDNISISLLTQSSVSRLRTLDLTCLRWKSPIIVVVGVVDPLNPSDSNLLQDYLSRWKIICQQLHVVIYHLDKETEGVPELYPHNMLRNVALESASTSHIFMIDVDFVPSQGLDDMIKSVLVKQQEDASVDRTNSKNENDLYDLNKDAIVIPAFDRYLEPACESNDECAQRLHKDPGLIPSNFDELHNCYFESMNCAVFQYMSNINGHSSTRTDLWLNKTWYVPSTWNATKNNFQGVSIGRGTKEEKLMIRTLPCFYSIIYEPYVTIRWCPITSASLPNVAPVSPYFDERFVEYGGDKIQHIQHLRQIGYRFLVLPHGGFLIHFPHEAAASLTAWMYGTENITMPDISALFSQFLGEVEQIYVTTVKTATMECSNEG